MVILPRDARRVQTPQKDAWTETRGGPFTKNDWVSHGVLAALSALGSAESADAAEGCREHDQRRSLWLGMIEWKKCFYVLRFLRFRPSGFEIESGGSQHRGTGQELDRNMQLFITKEGVFGQVSKADSRWVRC